MGGRRVVWVRTVSHARSGALARRDGLLVAAAAETARRQRLPLVLSLFSSGADVTEGINALDGWGRAAAAVAACSGVVPVVASLDGPALSGPALLLGLADLVVMTRQAYAYVSGPAMVASFTGVQVSRGALGGSPVHATTSGLCAVESDDPDEALIRLVDLMPDHCDELPPRRATDDPAERALDELRDVVPARSTAAYDVRTVCATVLDHDEMIEVWPRWAPQLVTAFGRLTGHVVGVVANQPRSLAGTLDIEASQKGARFVQLCDAFNIPLLTFVDTPGFLPGKGLEWRGMIRHGAELVFAYGEATVPRLCVIMRKAFGGAFIVMDSKGLGNDLCVAWPGAEIAVMGEQGAVQILHRRASPDQRSALERAYREELLTPWVAASRGLIDAVIDPADTRRVLAQGLSALIAKREVLANRKHGQGPL